MLALCREQICKITGIFSSHFANHVTLESTWISFLIGLLCGVNEEIGILPTPHFCQSNGGDNVMLFSSVFPWLLVIMNIFSYVFWPFIKLVLIALAYLLPLLNWTVTQMLICRHSSYIRNSYPLTVTRVANIFSQIVICVFSLFFPVMSLHHKITIFSFVTD